MSQQREGCTQALDTIDVAFAQWLRKRSSYLLAYPVSWSSCAHEWPVRTTHRLNACLLYNNTLVASQQLAVAIATGGPSASLEPQATLCLRVYD